MGKKIVLDTSVIISACHNFPSLLKEVYKSAKRYGKSLDEEFEIRNISKLLSNDILYTCGKNGNTCFVTPSVDREIRIEYEPLIRECFIKLRDGVFLDGEIVKIINIEKPDSKLRERIVYILEKMGFNMCWKVSKGVKCLSRTDIDLLTLAKQENAILVTMDSYMASACKVLGIEYIYIPQHVEKIHEKTREVLEEFREKLLQVIKV